MVLTFLLNGCFWGDESTHVPLAGKYYTITEADTKTILYFDGESPDAYAPLLSNVSAVGFSNTYLAVRDEKRYFLFNQHAASFLAAKETAIGPLDLKAFRRKLQQLGIDSTLRLSSAF